MNEEVEFIIDTTKEAMENAIKHLEKQFLGAADSAVGAPQQVDRRVDHPSVSR